MSHEADHQAKDRQAQAPGGPARPAGGAQSPLLAHLVGLQRLAGNAAATRLLTRQRPPARRQVVQRQQVPAGAGKGLDDAAKNALAAAGVILSPEDQAAIVGAFPEGVVVDPPKEVIAALKFGDRIDARRLTDIAIRPKVQPVKAGVQVHIFQVDKGRSILVSSIGGGSVLMDVGTGQSTSVNAPSVQRLVQTIGAVHAGGTAVPETIKLSHADADHYGACRALLTTAGYSRTAVEVATQQLGASSGGKWSTSSLVVQPQQRLVTVNVQGAGVQVSRTIIDNMELIEFRSVQAAQNLAQPGRRTFNRNASSPVVVVRDMVSGNRMLFTADAQGRQFSEMVNGVGPDALGRIMGAEGHNLKLMEAPHHFGKQAGPDATGMLNMLQLAYESGKGDLRLFAQTSQSFSSGASASYRFLDSTGLAPERVTGDPSGAGRGQVTKATGSTMQQVTLDLAGVQQAITTLQARESSLREAYSRAAQIEDMKADAVALKEALGQGSAPKALQASAAQMEADLTTQQNQLRAAADAVWDQARAAASGAGEMSGRANMTQVQGALTQLESHLNNSKSALERSGNNMEAFRAGCALYANLNANAGAMIDAQLKENVARLYELRADHTKLVAMAAGALGPAVVDEHVRAAWAATRAEWPPERFEEVTRNASRLIAMRQMSTEMRTYLATSLANQAELNEVVQKAEGGGRRAYGPGGTVVTPASTKVGVGILIALEVIRVGLEVAVQVKSASDAATARDAAAGVAGLNAVNWWVRQGVTPTVALAKRSSWDHTKFNVVYEGADAGARAVATGKKDPDFDMAVVTGVNTAELRKWLVPLIAQLASLEDWANLVGSFPPGPALARNGGAWGVRAFDKAAQGYGYRPLAGLDQGAATVADLDKLYTALEAGQAAKLTGAAAGASTVKDSAFWGSADRYAWVFNQSGRLERLNFGAVKPAFTVIGPDEASNARTGDKLTKVKAADVPTFQMVSPWYWISDSSHPVADNTGVHSEENLLVNSKGYAYVRTDHLIKPAPPAPAAS